MEEIHVQHTVELVGIEVLTGLQLVRQFDIHTGYTKDKLQQLACQRFALRQGASAMPTRLYSAR